MSSIHSDLETLFSGKIPDLDRLEQEIDVIIRNKEKKISDFDGRLKQATADLCSIETKLAMYKSELGSKTNTLEEKKNIIKDAIGEDDYDFIMSEIDKNISQFKE